MIDSKLLIGALAVAGIALAAVSGLTGSPDAPAQPAADPTGQLPPDHPPIPTGQPAAAATLSGTVEEVLHASGYTYARVTTATEGEIWAAGPVTELEVGETVGLGGAMKMGRFESPTMERTFDPLYFTDRFIKEGETMTAGAFRATVKQVIPAGRYVYLEIDYIEEGATGGPTWLAGPEMEVGEGDVVTWAGGTLMRDFASTTLDRTFDEILFVGQIQVAGGA